MRQAPIRNKKPATEMAPPNPRNPIQFFKRESKTSVAAGLLLYTLVLLIPQAISQALTNPSSTYGTDSTREALRVIGGMSSFLLWLLSLAVMGIEGELGWDTAIYPLASGCVMLMWKLLIGPLFWTEYVWAVFFPPYVVLVGMLVLQIADERGYFEWVAVSVGGWKLVLAGNLRRFADALAMPDLDLDQAWM